MRGSKKQEFSACYEAFFWRYGRAPVVEELNREYKLDFTQEEYESALTNPSLQTYFQERAIPNKYVEQPKLSPKQLDFLRLVFDPTDQRPLAVKMKQTKVSGGEHAAWMRDPNFARLVRDETTKQLDNGRPAIMRALIREASGGNVSAIKFYFELTGEYLPKSGNQVTVSLGQDVRELTQSILEILQRHVDGQTLLLIADELEAVLFPQTQKAALPVGSLPRPPKKPAELVIDVEDTEEASI